MLGSNLNQNKVKFTKKGRSLLDWMKVQRATKPIPASQLRKISLSELQMHNDVEDAWLVLEGIVFDVTKYMEYHPGGVDELMRGVGKDCTNLFYEVHSWVNYKAMLSNFQIGYFENNVIRKNIYTYDDFLPSTVECINYINHDTILLKLVAPMFISINNFQDYAFLKTTTGKLTKPYTITPNLINSPKDALPKDELRFLIKIYEKGPMTSQLAKLIKGDSCYFNFPFSTQNKELILPNSNIVLLAAGSGFTPMIRIINQYYSTLNNRMMYLFYFNKEECDIYFKKRLERLSKLNKNFILFFILSSPENDWTGYKGRISEQLLSSNIQPSHFNTSWLVCGPASFSMTAKKIIKTIKKENDYMFDFGSLG